jgi:two-component system response regulator FixJ
LELASQSLGLGKPPEEVKRSIVANGPNGQENDRGRLVLVVDDDPAVRDSTVSLLEHKGFRVAAFDSGTALIDTGIPAGTDVILLDIMMPGLNGLETLRVLRKSGNLPAVIILTGHGDIPLAVEAMKLGAIEFLEKPYPMKTLLELVSTVDRTMSSKAGDPERSVARQKVDMLTSRQREVLKGVALGEQSKVTAHRLNLSVRTVEAYRGQLFGRLGVRGMAEAVRVAVLAGLLEDDASP